MKTITLKKVISAIVIIVVFTTSFTVINAKGDQTRQKDREKDCTQDQIRLRDRDKDCQCDCICDRLYSQDKLQFKILIDEVAEDILLYQDLQIELEEAKEAENEALVEDIMAELEAVRLRLEEILEVMEDLEDELGLEFRGTIQNGSSYGKLYQLKFRISSLEQVIKAIEDLL